MHDTDSVVVSPSHVSAGRATKMANDGPDVISTLPRLDDLRSLEQIPNAVLAEILGEQIEMRDSWDGIAAFNNAPTPREH